MSQPLLSIGMIVKNEERCLEKCLKALEPLRQAIPCELVIADTGSTDRTKEIASKYADILFDFTWVNDFSAARNAVMDKCNGKWFLTIDADEYLSPEIDELLKFLKSPISKEKKIASVVQRNYYSTELTGNFADFQAVRMVRTDTNNRYSGRIHEQFTVDNYDDIYIFTNTIFNHDGYAEVTPDAVEKKEKRNLEILEDMLKSEPNNVKYILQCLESSGKNENKRKHFAQYGMDVLKTGEKNCTFWETMGPACARQIALFLYVDKSDNFLDWTNWTEKNFSNSDFIKIDLQYIKLKYYYSTQKHLDVIKTGKDYLKNSEKYKKSSASNNSIFISPMLYTSETHISEAIIIIANSMSKEGREEEAIKFLSKISVENLQVTSVNALFETFSLIKSEKTPDLLKNILAPIFDKENCNISKDVLSQINENIYLIFSVNNKTKNYNLLKTCSYTIGVSVEIIHSKSKEKVENLLSKIENWEEFMPLALKQALLLKCEFPKEFYTISSQRLNLLINDITNATEEIADVVINHYCNEENLKTFPQISFIFNLLLNTLFSNNIALKNELKSTLTNKFVFVAERYMTECYNENLLKNTEYINCIPNLHLFSWLLVNAFKEKEKDPLGYIKTLKEIIQKIPQAKQIVEFLIEEFKNEEELKRQEKIKTASPELIQMAEQLKTMLKAFPENSPELLAIKQSPVYKQVAFLIEE